MGTVTVLTDEVEARKMTGVTMVTLEVVVEVEVVQLEVEGTIKIGGVGTLVVLQLVLEVDGTIKIGGVGMLRVVTIKTGILGVTQTGISGRHFSVISFFLQ